MTLLLLLACTGQKGPPDRPVEDTAPPEHLVRPDAGRFDDLDGDGYTPASGDCDDTRYDTHPGSPEYCDRRDHDCDGQVYEEGMCGIVQPPSIAEVMELGDASDGIIREGHWTSDGSAGLLTNAHWGGDGYAHQSMLTVLPASPGFPTFGDLETVPFIAEPSEHLDTLNWGSIGDVDGDGRDDILMTSYGCGWEGAAWILPNPTTWTRGATWSESAIAWWADDLENACFGISAGGGGDLDGDGYGDILVSQGADYSNSWGPWGTEDDYGLWVLRGGGGQAGAAPDGLFLPADGYNDDTQHELLYNEMVGDVTGDGIARMVIQTRGSVHELRFVNPLMDGAATYEQLVEGGDVITFSGDPGAIDPETLSATLDWTGDGVNDVVVNGVASLSGFTDHQEVNVLDLSGWDGSAAIFEDFEYLRVVNEASDDAWGSDLNSWMHAPVNDIDGDGFPDIALNIQDRGMGLNGGGGCVIGSSRLQAGTQVFEDVALCYGSMDERLGGGSYAPMIGDWDLSGEPDLLFPMHGNDTVRFVPGEDLPWDDPTMW